MSTASGPVSGALKRGLPFAVALAAAIVAVSLAILPSRLALVSIVLGTTMLAIASIDADRFIIPDWLSLPAIPAGLLASGRMLDPGAGDLVDVAHVVAVVLGGASLWAVAVGYKQWRGEDGLGLGDVKLAGAAGAWVGPELLALVLLLAAGAALTWAFAIALRRRESLDARTRVPFGLFLAPSIWAVWIASVSGGLG